MYAASKAGSYFVTPKLSTMETARNMSLRWQPPLERHLTTTSELPWARGALAHSEKQNRSITHSLSCAPTRRGIAEGQIRTVV